MTLKIKQNLPRDFRVVAPEIKGAPETIGTNFPHIAQWLNACFYLKKLVWMCKLNTQDAEQPEDAADPALGQDQRGPAAGARGEGQVGGSSVVDLINSNKNG